MIQVAPADGEKTLLEIIHRLQVPPGVVLQTVVGLGSEAIRSSSSRGWQPVASTLLLGSESVPDRADAAGRVCEGELTGASVVGWPSSGPRRFPESGHEAREIIVRVEALVKPRTPRSIHGRLPFNHVEGGQLPIGAESTAAS